MMCYTGIDLHATNSVVVILDAEDRVLRQKRLRNELPLILAALEPYRATVQGIAVESTYNWYWLVDGLMEAGYRVYLAHAPALPQYSGLKHADDEHDAQWLAHLLRLGLLPTGYIYPKAERAVRDLLRKRSQLVRHKTMVVLSLQSLLTRLTGTRLSHATGMVRRDVGSDFAPFAEYGGHDGLCLLDRSFRDGRHLFLLLCTQRKNPGTFFMRCATSFDGLRK